MNDNFSKNRKFGGAYIYVIMIMMMVFLLTTAALSMTATSRLTSSRYISFAGLYNLAVAGNERAMILLMQELNDNRDEILEAVRLRLLSEVLINEHLTYHDGHLELRGPFALIFSDEKNKVIDSFLNLRLREQSYFDHLMAPFTEHYFSYRLALSTGVYYVHTGLEAHQGGYRVRSRAAKEVNGRRSADVVVYGNIEWPSAHAIVIPTYYEFMAGNPGDINVIDFVLQVEDSAFTPRLRGVQRVGN